MIRTSRVVVLSSVLCLVSFPVPAQEAQQTAEPCAAMPATVRVDSVLQPVVATLLRQSETFRKQCLTIASARGVRVEVRSAAPRALGSAPRAHAQITRFEYGLVRAVIEIPIGSDYAELLPHEFEHVIEIIEGIDLAEQAAHGEGVDEVDEGAFETARARAAGHAASREVTGDTDPAVRRAGRHIGRMWRAISGGAPAESTVPGGPPTRR